MDIDVNNCGQLLQSYIITASACMYYSHVVSYIITLVPHMHMHVAPR